MGESFAPYLKDVLPGIFQSACLSPSMGIAGTEGLAALTDLLSEIKPEQKKKGGDGEDDSHTNVMTDEIDEKDVAIQMLAVFIDTLGAAYIEWVDQTATVLL